MKLPGLFIDLFAGGGGASTGIEQAIGGNIGVAVNHSPTAIAIHKANHPDTEHHCTDIRQPFLPRTATRGRRVAGVWASPDCKEFSKAKGGPVKDRSIRTLADEIPHWLEETHPDVAYVENVEEFEDWGPLEQGEDGKWRVIVDRKGEDFQKWVKRCRRVGYRVAWRQLRACDYGAPTSRKRLYIVMRRDKKPVVWPKPTHARPDDPRVIAGKLLPYRTAAECIDWSIRCPSIFERDRELAEATKRRIAHGVMRYVVNAAHPFIVRTAHGDDGRHRTHPLGEPLGTQPASNEFSIVDCEIAPHITKFRGGAVGSDMRDPTPTVTANGVPARPAGATPLGMVAAHLHKMAQNGVGKDAGEPLDTAMAGAAKHGVVGATLVKMGNGEREGQEPRALDVGKPYGTVTAKGSQAAAVTAELAYLDQQNGKSVGAPADQPAPSATTHAKTGQVTAFLSSFYGSDKTNGSGEPERPLRSARAGGQHHAVVAAHLEQANGGPRNKNSAGRDARRPLSTATTTGSQQRIVETTMIEEGALPPEMMARAVRTAAFLVKYYGTDGESETAQTQPVDRPIDVITVKARFAVVTVTIDATTYVIVDIGLRMLKPRELARAQGFPDSYVLNPVVRKFLRGKWVERPLTIAEQISAIGNSVCPPVARALVAANQPDLVEMDKAA